MFEEFASVEAKNNKTKKNKTKQNKGWSSQRLREQRFQRIKGHWADVEEELNTDQWICPEDRFW